MAWTFLTTRGLDGLAARWAPRLLAVSALLLVAGLYGGLVLAPTDEEQGEAYRIIYVHVPAAWLSLYGYVTMAGLGAVALIWRIRVAEVLMAAAAPVGAAFTALALATGSIWGKPMWGTWWVWDARLTSELILLFLYIGVMALRAAAEDPRAGARAAAILALAGVVNVPIVHFSVEWWNTLHQGPTVTRLAAPAIHPAMLVPLLLMAAAFMVYHAGAVLLRARCLLAREPAAVLAEEAA